MCSLVRLNPHDLAIIRTYIKPINVATKTLLNAHLWSVLVTYLIGFLEVEVQQGVPSQSIYIHVHM